MASSTRWRVCGETLGLLLSTRDMVATETLASRATSEMVAMYPPM